MNHVFERVNAIPRYLADARGWRRWIAAFFLGVALALAFAPFYALPLMAVAFSGALFLLDGIAGNGRERTKTTTMTVRSAFAVGWWFGLGFFVVSLHWFAFAFFVQAATFGWMAPFAVIGLSGFLAAFHGAAFALAGAMFLRLFDSEAWRRVLVFAAAFMVFEYLRGTILTGLPWNLPAQALAGAAVGAQGAAWLGVYGLSLFAVAIAATPAAFVRATSFHGDDAAISIRACLKSGVSVMLAAVGLLYGAGAARLLSNPAQSRTDAAVRVVQPNIPQREKIDPALWGRNVRRALDLSSGPFAGEGALYVIWPENAASLIDESPDALAAIDRALPPQAILLAGAVRRRQNPDGRIAYHNALAIAAPDDGALGVGPSSLSPLSDAINAIQDAASVSRTFVGFYDKHHLVPFGEYLPLSGTLKAIGLAQLAPFEDGFAKGAGPQTFAIGPAPFAPMICYEAIFPGATYPQADRPDWLAVVTNDAWFGDTAGPRQHLDQARLRSIETGLPMARAANTGISVIIDGAGRYVQRVPLYETGVIDAPLPVPLPRTLYTRIGEAGFFAILAIFAIAGLYIRPPVSMVSD
ncbi:MAG: apolipoprotein N-acyltransferase [Pseudomonadota bacterium]